MIPVTQLVLLCLVRKCITTGRRWATNLADLLRAKA
jgi:hypothetical protein